MTGPPGQTWAPRWRSVGGLAVAGLALGWLGVGSDAEGRLLLGLAGLGLLALVARDLLSRPVLTVDPAGITVVQGLRRRRVAWDDLGSVTATRTSRGLLVGTALELEIGDGLVVVGRHRLGADPEIVADRIAAARPVSR